MLKSTYSAKNPLPPDWTEHTAPTGHPYYYNSVTKTSTYTRPDGGQTDSSRAGVLEEINILPSLIPTSQNSFDVQVGLSIPNSQHFPSARDQPRRTQHRDRPKSSKTIPGCEPWLLVQTRLNRRFVFNPERNESFWKFPSDVLLGVLELDRSSREKRQKLSEEIGGAQDDSGKVANDKRDENDALHHKVFPKNTELNTAIATASDDDYEEVEVTDDEDANTSQKDGSAGHKRDEQQLEFDEDDMLYQLEALGKDYELDPEDLGDVVEEGDTNQSSLTSAEEVGLFMDMLEDHAINPYTTWETLVEAGTLIEDDRYTALPNMRSRQQVWTNWSAEKIRLLNEDKKRQRATDPKIVYLDFLHVAATPKLYWPEFRRKHQREAPMRSSHMSDKEREKLYREHISRLKLPEAKLKADLLTLLDSVPVEKLNRGTMMHNLPDMIQKDLRFISLKDEIRKALITKHIAGLPVPPPQEETNGKSVHNDSSVSEAERRQMLALAERERQVTEGKRKQQQELRHSRAILREGEQILGRAQVINKDGLLSHLQDET